MINFEFNDTFNKELPADPNLENSRRQVFKSCFSYVTPRVPTNPQLIHVSEEMLTALGLNSTSAASKDFLEIFSGTKVMDGTKPYAMCYAGHQFGNWAGQLGDGRAINLAEVIHDHKRWALQLKGAGETPYSRGADGLAVLRSSIREHLCSEAMHHLGVPTTRSLSLMLTGDQVLRDIMYDGNAAYEKGAVVCRVAPTFIRFGNFQIFAARQDLENLKILCDYTIRHFFPEIELGTKESYIEWFRQVTQATLDMIVHWQRVGFVHGVMNTDNMSILGLTIDYGPYGWLEGYDSNWTPNTTDREQKRYRFGYQPRVAQWNLIQLANAIFPLIEDASALEDILHGFQKDYIQKHLDMMRDKLGFAVKSDEDEKLIKELEQQLHEVETDMTIFFRTLSHVQKDSNPTESFLLIQNAFYNLDELSESVRNNWLNWFSKYLSRLKMESRTDSERRHRMDAVNPKYVLRNYMAQLAIEAAEKGDYNLLSELHEILKSPYAEQPEAERWFAKRPEWARVKVGCSMLSCSS